MIDGDIYRQMGIYRCKFVFLFPWRSQDPDFNPYDIFRYICPFNIYCSYPLAHHPDIPISLPIGFLPRFLSEDPPLSSSIVAVFLSCPVACVSSQQLLLVPRFLISDPANSDCPGNEMRRLHFLSTVALKEVSQFHSDRGVWRSDK